MTEQERDKKPDEGMVKEIKKIICEKCETIDNKGCVGCESPIEEVCSAAKNLAQAIASYIQSRSVEDVELLNKIEFIIGNEIHNKNRPMKHLYYKPLKTIITIGIKHKELKI